MNRLSKPYFEIYEYGELIYSGDVISIDFEAGDEIDAYDGGIMIFVNGIESVFTNRSIGQISPENEYAELETISLGTKLKLFNNPNI